MPEIDYDKIAECYDRHRGVGGPYQARLVELALASDARRVLEIGPGTGNNTAALLAAYPCEVIALELSQGMIAKARAKGVSARWIHGSGLAIPLASNSVDFVLGVYVLHHIGNLDGVLRECARVLGPGMAVFVTASMEYIERHPMNRYFPSFGEIDKARFQPVEEIQAAFERTGFHSVRAERFLDTPRPIDKAFADKVANKFVSTYELIPPEEFATGLARLYADLEARGCLEEQLVWESVAVWGRKNSV